MVEKQYNPGRLWRGQDLGVMSPSEREVFIAFGTLQPAIATYPHCVFKNGPSALSCVVEAIGCRVGVWGERPMFDADGQTYLEPPNGEVTDDFRLFATSANQAIALDSQAFGKLGAFSMCIDALTPVAIIKRLWEPFACTDHVEYYDAVGFLPSWLDLLGWAYIPLEYEYEHALFVTSPERSEVMKMVLATAEGRHEPTKQMRAIGTQTTLTDRI